MSYTNLRHGLAGMRLARLGRWCASAFIVSTHCSCSGVMVAVPSFSALMRLKLSTMTPTCNQHTRARCSRLSGAPPSPERAGVGASCVALAADEEVHREEGADEHPRDRVERRRREVVAHRRVPRRRGVHHAVHVGLPLVARRHDVEQQHRPRERVERAHARVGPLDLARAVPRRRAAALERPPRGVGGVALGLGQLRRVGARREPPHVELHAEHGEDELPREEERRRRGKVREGQGRAGVGRGGVRR